MMDLDALLTGRELVAALEQMRVGTWSAAAVRQWTREEPPMAIAAPADQGKPHRYRLRDALTWLKARALAERAKGYTRADGDDLVSKLDLALSGLPVPPPSSESAVPGGQAQNFAANTSPTSGAGAGAESGSTQLSQAKPLQQQTDWLALSSEEALMRVLEGRDPRNWKAAEEAMTTRRERLEAERRLIPIEELDAALDENVMQTAAAIRATAPKLKLALRDLVHPDRHHECDRVLDSAFNDLLKRLAGADDSSVMGDAA